MRAALLLTGLAVLAPQARAESRARPLPPPPAAALEMVRGAREAVEKSHEGLKLDFPKLRMVYFTPSDTEPQADHQSRLTRVMRDVSEFYRDELNRYGVESGGLPLEMEGAQLKLHEVKGLKSASGYVHESGGETEREMRAALKGTVDFDREFVLALYSMCRKNEDGSYFFYAPYYGKSGSNQQWGLCHAADCELLDPELLGETRRRIVYEEHYGNFRKTLADFNTAYLGGIAHELGHGLSLPHNGETEEEREVLGKALMGGGNLTYRREIWDRQGKGKGSFLTLATVLRLVSHPLLAGSGPSRQVTPQAEFTDRVYQSSPHQLSLSGTVTADIAPYAMIAYVDPAARPGDYDALTSCALVGKDGKFQLEAPVPEPGNYQLRVTALHVNGATTTWRSAFTADGKSVADVDSLKSPSRIRELEELALRNPRQVSAKLTEANIQAAPTVEDRELLASLKQALEETDAPAADAETATGDRLWLSEAQWTEASVGWGKPARNRMGGGAPRITGYLLSLGGKFHARGLYAHSPSRYGFPLGAKWGEFTATAGIKDGDAPFRNAVFVVKGDGKELYRSPKVSTANPQSVKVPLKGVAFLELIVEGGDGPEGHSWAVWGSPLLTR